MEANVAGYNEVRGMQWGQQKGACNGQRGIALQLLVIELRSHDNFDLTYTLPRQLCSHHQAKSAATLFPMSNYSGSSNSS